MVKKQVNKRRIFIVILGIITVFTIYLVLRGDIPVSNNARELPSPSPEDSISAEFDCGDDKTIKAEFVNSGERYVNLELSDGQKYTLPSAVSADGARYASNDESVVFWNVGNTATLEQNGVTTYDNCSTAN